MIVLVFSIEEPNDREAIETIVTAVVDDCKLHMSHLTSVKGYIAVDEAADNVLAVVNPT